MKQNFTYIFESYFEANLKKVKTSPKKSLSLSMEIFSPYRDILYIRTTRPYSRSSCIMR